MNTTSLQWSPQPRQETFLIRSEDEALYGGSKGGGKTDALLFGGLDQKDKPNYKAILFRRTYPQLQEIIDRSLRYFPGVGGRWAGQLHRWSFPAKASAPLSLHTGGSTFSFRSVNNQGDEYDYQGHEYQYMAFDQLEQFTEPQYAFLSAQARTSDPNIQVYVRSTANPGGVGHGWVKRKFIAGYVPERTYRTRYELPIPITMDDGESLTHIDRTSTFVPATVYDNQKLLQSNPQYLGNLMGLPSDMRRALLEGDWDVFAGQYFTEWRYNIHVCQPFKIPESWPRYISLDYGYTAPSSVHWWAVNEDGQLYCYRELYRTKLDYKALAKEIKNLTPKKEQPLVNYVVADPAVFAKRAGPSGAEEMSSQGLNVIPGDNDRINGWNTVRQYLAPYRGKNGALTAKIQVFSNNVNLIRTFPDLIHDVRRPEDLDTTGEDHCADDVRYFVQSRAWGPKKEKPIDESLLPPSTPEERVQRELDQLAKRAKTGPIDDVLGSEY